MKIDENVQFYPVATHATEKAAMRPSERLLSRFAKKATGTQDPYNTDAKVTHVQMYSKAANQPMDTGSGFGSCTQCYSNNCQTTTCTQCYSNNCQTTTCDRNCN